MTKVLQTVLLAALLLLGGCASLWTPKTQTPIPFEVHGNIETAEHVTVLLPGIRNRMEDFKTQGFLDIARPLLEEYPDSALITVDAHWGYYRQRSIDTRLAEDLLARYPDKTFTFVGISLGGFGSLLMATRFSDRINKLVLLSPFLGDDGDYLEKLKARGPVDRPDEEDIDRTLNHIWRFMTDPERRIPIYIAYGMDDKFVPFYDHLRSHQPRDIQFLEIRGGHDWETWRTLWTALAPIAIGRF